MVNANLYKSIWLFDQQQRNASPSLHFVSCQLYYAKHSTTLMKSDVP